MDAATLEYDPAEQFKHEADPFVLLYVPEGQALQGPPSAPKYPGLQVHRRADNAPCTDHEWSKGHPAHMEFVVAPVLLEIFT